MLIAGVILIVVAVICFFIARSQANKLAAMNAADTYTAQLLQELHGKVTSSLGAESFAEACEVEGVIECEQPLVAPLSNTPCVAYVRTRIREYEEEVTSTDSE